MKRTIQMHTERAMIAGMIQTMCLVQLPLIALWYLLKGRDDGSEPNVVRAVCYVLVSWTIAMNFILCVVFLVR